MDKILYLFIGYAFGLIQNAYIAGRLFGNIDIREHGSKSAGFTNVNRVMGFKAGLAVFVLDIAKALLACFICAFIYRSGSGITIAERLTLPLDNVPVLYAGLGVILGHDFPFYLKFKGGKGIASTVGILFCLDPLLAAACYAVTIAVIALSKTVSLGSLVLSAMFPVIACIGGFQLETFIIALLIALIAFYQHRGNIVRLINGTESKFSFKSKKK